MNTRWNIQLSRYVLVASIQYECMEVIRMDGRCDGSLRSRVFTLRRRCCFGCSSIATSKETTNRSMRSTAQYTVNGAVHHTYRYSSYRCICLDIYCHALISYQSQVIALFIDQHRLLCTHPNYFKVICSKAINSNIIVLHLSHKEI